MNEIVFQFFNVFGLDTTAPVTFPDLIVWLVCVFVGLMLTLAVWRFFSAIIGIICGGINR